MPLENADYSQQIIEAQERQKDLKEQQQDMLENIDYLNATDSDGDIINVLLEDLDNSLSDAENLIDTINDLASSGGEENELAEYAHELSTGEDESMTVDISDDGYDYTDGEDEYNLADTDGEDEYNLADTDGEDEYNLADTDGEDRTNSYDYDETIASSDTEINPGLDNIQTMTDEVSGGEEVIKRSMDGYGEAEAKQIPKSFIPKNMPSGDLPSSNMPSGDLPSSNIPSGDLPSSNMPSGDLPSSNIPKNMFQDKGANDIPRYRIPDSGLGGSNRVNDSQRINNSRSHGNSGINIGN